MQSAVYQSVSVELQIVASLMLTLSSPEDSCSLIIVENANILV